MADFANGDRVLVNTSAGLLPGAQGAPDWEPGTVVGRTANGMYRVRLDEAIANRTAEKEAAPEHVRLLNPKG